MPIVIGVLCVLFGLMVAVALLYNRLVRYRNLMREGWSGIDVQLKRRHDLIPNIVALVKGYRDYEKSLLEAVTKARSQPFTLDALKQAQAAENALTQVLRNMFAVVEAYPDLKANQNFLDLQHRLADIEDQIQMARRYYNGTVRNYNIRVQSFPGNLVADLFGFQSAEFFEIETATERVAPTVEM